MSLTPVECANCGAKYRLPETFKADKAKCKKCGAMIDVASQRAAPPAAEPKRAAASASSASSSRRPAPSRRASAKSDGPAKRGGSSPSRARRSARARGGEDDGGDEPRSRRGGRSRRGAEPEPKKSNTAVIAGSIIGVLAVVLVVVIYLMQGGDEKANESQQATAPEGASSAEKQAGEQAGAGEAETATTDEGAPEETKEIETTLDVEPKVEEAAAKKPEPKKAELSSHEDVFKPRDELEPLPWPDFVSEEERTEITEGLAAIRDGGIAGTHAKTRLEELDGKAVVGIVNQLRDLNYFDSEDTMFAYELNRLLGAMSTGINADFRPCELGAEISLEDADWNGKTVKAWQRFAEKYGQDTESLPRLRAHRRSNDK